ncbi:polycomb group protein Psc-like [Anoplophora glabripennis]|uniref:polycomb group protein Psc-like n=1 Tax=Anoplophora glabripennis TaxID=217634 RepID=UPI0008757F27|nr:polycomb group protein Psc-like [Anoplophora glabripennis]
MELPARRPEKIKLREINPYLTCYLCKGYLVDATTISECLHSFCRSCIIKFLQENSFCPVCEVIINKAKPNLKLDKTLQDIVYKLVPELFLKEMTRRKLFYQQYPQIAVRVSPEERGEDTERTIFNPKDCISLSMEYVSDDSTPGAICLPGTKNGLDKNKNLTAEENQALMKRYLQCPGMCRVEVLKKFVRNKYNVDTNRFYIDILYKRVPLPDHYTLIDIAYIYSWKRNEPMTFYFRITDINKVSERFDFFNGSPVPEFVMKTPSRTSRTNGERGSAKRKESANKRPSKVNKQPSQETTSECDRSNSETKIEIPSERGVGEVKNKCDSIGDNKSGDSNGEVVSKSLSVKATSSNVDSKNDKPVQVEKKAKTVEKPAVVVNTNPAKVIPNTKDKDKTDVVQGSMLLKPEIAEQIKTKIQNDKSDVKNSVYTNITLNRTNNVEIITKIQKVSNKEGQPIGLNIIKQTVKKGGKTGGASPVHKTATKKVVNEKKQPESNKVEIVNKIENEKVKKDQVPTTSDSLEEEKHKFFKSIELTAKNVVQGITTKQNETCASSSGQKRKSSSPVKNDKAKKSKVDKKPTTKIIIQPKPPNHGKPSIPSQHRNSGLQSFIDSCKINIPSSLSITLKETSEGRPPPLVPPTKNYIEILKLDENECTNTESAPKPESVVKTEPASRLCDNDSEQKVDQDLSEIAKSLTEKIPMSTTVSQIVGPKPQFQIPVKNNAPIKFHIQPSPVPEVPCKVLNMPKDNKLNPRSPQTFQKIFEESIKKPDENATSPEKNKQKVLDLTNEPASAPSVKRNILEIASQLYKKTKLEQEKSTLPETKSDESNSSAPVPKVPIPRLPSQKVSKSRQKFAGPRFEVADALKFPQTLTNLHSNALGLNYTISVGQNIAPKVNGILSPVKKEEETKTEKLCKPPVTSNSCAAPKELPSASPRPNMKRSPCLNYNSPRNSPKHSPKSSPVVKHMYAPTPNLMDQLRVHTLNQKIPSPKLNNFSKSSPNSSKLPSPSQKLPSPLSKPSTPSPKTSLPSSSNSAVKPLQPGTSPKTSEASPSSNSSKNAPKPSSGSQNSPLSPNQILEKYNIQNLAQLTASLNFNAANFGLNPNNQLAALQHAMLLKHFEMQNRQNWLNMNQGPLLQYEKYLQSLKSNPNQLLGNIKEN